MREPIVPQLDADEFLRWEARQTGRFELHHGFVLSFAGSSVDHDRISFNVRMLLESLFPAPCRSFGADLKIHVAASSFYYGDAGVACEELAPDATFVEKPCVVADVLSPSTRTYDLVENRATYRAIPSMVFSSSFIPRRDGSKSTAASTTARGKRPGSTTRSPSSAIAKSRWIPFMRARRSRSA